MHDDSQLALSDIISHMGTMNMDSSVKIGRSIISHVKKVFQNVSYNRDKKTFKGIRKSPDIDHLREEITDLGDKVADVLTLTSDTLSPHQPDIAKLVATEESLQQEIINEEKKVDSLTKERTELDFTSLNQFQKITLLS